MSTTRALVVGLLIVALTTACSDDDDDAATSTTTAAPTSTTFTPGTTAPTTPAPELVDPADTARAWIAAVASGDDDAAIALTSSRSLDAIGGANGFAAREIELAEGWGVWDTTDAPIEVTAVSVPSRDGVAVVILHGEVAHEGPPEESWAALPVVATPDGDRVEPFLDLGDIEVDPPANAELTPPATLAAFALGGRDVHLVVDDAEAAAPSIEGADGDRQRATVEVEDLELGMHALTVVLTNDDGVMARTFFYTVAD